MADDPHVHEELKPYISVQDVYNVITEHMHALDQLWPDSDRFGPRKVNLVELLDSIKLKLVERAEKKANRYESAYDKSFRKIAGIDKAKPPGQPSEEIPQTKTPMQVAAEDMRARIQRNRS